MHFTVCGVKSIVYVSDFLGNFRSTVLLVSQKTKQGVCFYEKKDGTKSRRSFGCCHDDVQRRRSGAAIRDGRADGMRGVGKRF